jgi:hypothetical protein
MSEPKVCNMLFGHCKRGHPRSKETTFERKVTIRRPTGWERSYIVRECRICHAMRYNDTKKSWTKFQSKSKWSALRFPALEGS